MIQSVEELAVSVDKSLVPEVLSLLGELGLQFSVENRLLRNSTIKIVGEQDLLQLATKGIDELKYTWWENHQW